MASKTIIAISLLSLFLLPMMILGNHIYHGNYWYSIELLCYFMAGYLLMR